MDVITFPVNGKPLVVYRFYCMALFHSQTGRHMINNFNRHNFNRYVNHKLFIDFNTWHYISPRSLPFVVSYKRKNVHKVLVNS